MAKSIGVDQKSLAIALLLGLVFQYLPYFNLPFIGKIIILIVAILLLLK